MLFSNVDLMKVHRWLSEMRRRDVSWQVIIGGGANTEAADISGWTMLIHATLFEDPALVKVRHRVCGGVVQCETPS